MTTTTTAKHSPTPWEFSADDKLNVQRAFGIVRPLPESESQEPGHTEVIAEVCDGPTAEADAIFITTACNAHDDLLAACKAAEDAFNNPQPITVINGKRCATPATQVAIELIRAAIRKAGGEA